jgi:undecaprenyl-diphosphatase
MLITAVLISVMIGFPLLLLIREVQLTEGAGDVTMILIGSFMVISGFVQRYRRNSIANVTREALSIIDVTILGIAQGLAVMPGLSRSGLTVSVLLLRGLEQQKAITISYIISIPAALGAAVYIGITDGLFLSAINLLAGFVAFVSGLFTIRIVLGFAKQVNISKLLIWIGLMMVFASIPFLTVRLYLA